MLNLTDIFLGFLHFMIITLVRNVDVARKYITKLFEMSV